MDGSSNQNARAVVLVRSRFLAGVRALAQPLALESAKLLKLSTEMDDSQPSISPSPTRQRFLRRQPLGIFVLLGVFVFLFWLGSLAFVCHRLNVPHLEEHRLQTIAQVGEAMAITGVLFSGLGFVALIATVWLQRKQIEAAIQGMEESTKAQRDNLATLQAQSENTLAVAKISALAVRISAYNSDIIDAAIRDPVKKVRSEEKRNSLVEELEAELQKLKEKEKSGGTIAE